MNKPKKIKSDDVADSVAKNNKAYNDVLDCCGPSMPHDEEYMMFYQSWYPLGAMTIEDFFDE